MLTRLLLLSLHTRDKSDKTPGNNKEGGGGRGDEEEAGKGSNKQTLIFVLLKGKYTNTNSCYGWCCRDNRAFIRAGHQALALCTPWFMMKKSRFTTLFGYFC